MKKFTPFWIGMAVVALLAGAGAAAFLFISNIPPVTQQVEHGGDYILVNLTHPLSGDALPLNAPTRVDVDAVGVKPLTRLELWADNQLVGSTDLAKTGAVQATTPSAFYAWTPPQAGTYTLVARAYDSDGHFALSNAVSVTASAEANLTVLSKHALASADTLDSLAQQNHTTLDALHKANPDLKPGGPLPPAGSSINIPISAPPVVLHGGTETGPTPYSTPSAPEKARLTESVATQAALQPPPAPQPPAAPLPPAPSGSQNAIPANLPVMDLTGKTADKFSFWVTRNISGIFGGNSQSHLDPITAGFPLNVSAKGCYADLRFQAPSGSGATVETFTIYRLDPLSSKYKPVATLPGSNSGLVLGYLDSGLFGKFSYYVTAVVAPFFKEVTSSIATLDITDPNCNQGQWSSLVVTRADMTSNPVMDGGVYCYLTLNNNPWGRIPNQFTVPLTGGYYDLRPYFPNISPTSMPSTFPLSLECYGLSGSQVVPLGKATQSIDTTKLPATVTFTGSNFTAVVTFAKGSSTAGSQPAPSNLTPPTALRLGTTVQDCTSHLSIPLLNGLFCGATVFNNYTHLIWEWKPAFCPGAGLGPNGTSCGMDNSIDGYRIYRMDGLKPAMMQENQQTGTKVYMFQRPPPDPNGFPPCYVVRSYRGAVESVNSNLFCLPNNSAQGITSLTLDPSYKYTEDTFSDNSSKDFGCIDNAVFHKVVKENEDFGPGAFNAGYNYFWTPGTIPPNCWWYDNYFRRPVIQFDLSNVKGGISWAMLKFSHQKDYQSASSDTIRSYCGQALNIVNSYDGDFIGSYDYIDPIANGSGDESLLVSSAARRWQQFDRAKTGNKLTFMINTNHEDPTAHSNDACFTKLYESFKLSIVYFNQ